MNKCSSEGECNCNNPSLTLQWSDSCNLEVSYYYYYFYYSYDYSACITDEYKYVHRNVMLYAVAADSLIHFFPCNVYVAHICDERYHRHNVFASPKEWSNMWNVSRNPFGLTAIRHRIECVFVFFLFVICFFLFFFSISNRISAINCNSDVHCIPVHCFARRERRTKQRQRHYVYTCVCSNIARLSFINVPSGKCPHSPFHFTLSTRYTHPSIHPTIPDKLANCSTVHIDWCMSECIMFAWRTG